MAFKPRLVLRVIWSADFANGDDLARHVYSRLCRDVERPASRGLGIPVYFHSGLTPTAAGLPESLDLDAAESTVVIALLDNSIRGDSEWRDCIREMESRITGSGRRHLFLPIACEDRVLGLVEKTNCVRLYKVAATEMPERLVSALTHELARLLLAKFADVATDSFGTLEKSYAPVKLFLSHSKHGPDGTLIATELRDYGRQHLPVATFYDSNDIAAGHDFEKEILANAAESAVVVIHTDTYSDRSWCRKEVLAAKRFGCPVLVVNAVTVGEERLFPYLGNAPSVRWLFDSSRRCEIVIDAALREVLRNIYFVAHVRAIKKAGYLADTNVEIATAPEVLTYLNLVHAKKCDRTKPSILLYPDPPLGDEEIELLENLNPSNITVTTPTTVAIAPSPGVSDPPLKDQLIGLSISNSPDLSAFGMGLVHLEDAMVECARHLLTQGASLAYGGDLRPGGFTTILFELVRSHNRAGTKERIHNFLAWPIGLHVDAGIWREYMDEIRDYRVAPPVDLGLDPTVDVGPDDMPGRYIWSRSLTAMRVDMNSQTAARVLLGGQVRGFKGKYPGVLEEALLALRSKKPLYLVGGFGGCTQSIVQALKGDTPEAFTEAFQSTDPLFATIAARYQIDAAEGKGNPINYAGELKYLQSVGLVGLENGLSEDENNVLSNSKNLPEIVYLVLKGLSQRLK
jgi:hypothetical protein